MEQRLCYGTFESAQLRVKIKSLAEEARIIRLEEYRHTVKQWSPDNFRYEQFTATRNSLHRHRTVDVRDEARAAHIAYGFLRGRDFSKIENPDTTDHCNDRAEAVLKRACRIAQKFRAGGYPQDVIEQEFKEWIKRG